MSIAVIENVVLFCTVLNVLPIQVPFFEKLIFLNLK